ncbi:MAG: hypothetical protein IOD11_18840 [Rhodocyclaceae bacterium]|nr:hypothetical protein [Rhodocyclaceae bacterium]
MPNDITLPGIGEKIVSDEVATRQYQRFKLTDGAPGSEVHARVMATNADANTPGMAVRPTPQYTWSVSFTRSNASDMDTPEMTKRRQGAGVTLSQSSGNLVVASGTTANSEFLARSVESFNGALIQRHQVIASQRIANNNFAVLLADLIAEGANCTINSATSITVQVTAHGLTAANVGQSMNVGAINGANGIPGRYAILSIPDANNITFSVTGWPASGSCTVDLFGWNYVRWLYTGVTATNAAIDAQRYGWASGDTTATINTTASPGHLAQTSIDGRNIFFSDALVASSATPSVTTRGHRVVNIPDDEIELFLYLWAFNGSTAPASSTTWTVGFVAAEDVVNVPFYLAGIRQQGFAAPLPVVFPAAQAVSFTMPALVAGSAAIGDVGVQYRASATGAGTPTNINSPATPALQTIKGTAGRLLGLTLLNTNAATRFLKVFNVVSPTLGTTAATLDIALPPNVPVSVTYEGGIGFATAITCIVTGGRGLTDNTAITGNEVTGFTLHA